MHVYGPDARELLDLRRDGLPRLHEGVVAPHDLLAADARRGYLYQLAFLEGEARGLGVDHHELVVVLDPLDRVGRNLSGDRVIEGRRQRVDIRPRALPTPPGILLLRGEAVLGVLDKLQLCRTVAA